MFRQGCCREGGGVRGNVARMRPEYALADPADRMAYEPGPDPPRLMFTEARKRVFPVPVMGCSQSQFVMAR